MPGPKKKKQQPPGVVKRWNVSAARAHRVLELYYEHGLTMAGAAKMVGVSKSTALMYVQQAKQRWREEISGWVNEAQAASLAKLAAIEREAWDGWFRSQEDDVEESESATSGDDAGSPKTTKSTRRRGQAGDSSFLKTIRECVAESAKILGLYAADKHEHAFGETFTTREQLVAELRAAIQQTKPTTNGKP